MLAGAIKRGDGIQEIAKRLTSPGPRRLLDWVSSATEAVSGNQSPDDPSGSPPGRDDQAESPTAGAPPMQICRF